ncbi:hypothetical protein ACIBP6_40160 [Nonomuraea terrae]|uniref:hypothetical protein n=1 Tax=Nonomuraea terrae TaxID=2530383 RepID=UPI0037BB1D72
MTLTRITGRLSRWWLVLSLTVGALGGLAYAMARDAVYAADAYVVVSGVDPVQAAHFATAYARIAGHPGLLTTDRAEQDALSVAASPDAPLVRLTSEAPTGSEAAERANSAAAALIRYANTHATDTRVRLASFAEALAPSRPSSPIPLVSMAAGGCAAALVTGLVRLAGPFARREPAAVLRGAHA